MAAAPALGFWLRRGRYLEGISWLTLERDHIIHQVALSCLHSIAGYSWFGTTAQAHRWTRPKQGERRVHKLGRLRWQRLRVLLLAAWGPRLVPSRAPANLSIWQAEEVRTYRMEAHQVKAGMGVHFRNCGCFVQPQATLAADSQASLSLSNVPLVPALNFPSLTLPLEDSVCGKKRGHRKDRRARDS